MRAIDHGETIIEVRDVSFSYGRHEIVHDVNLSIHRGDYLAIVGGNGSGKTTLLKLMLGLLTPARGSIRLLGKDVSEFKEWQRIGYVRQHATNVDSSVPATAREVVLMGRFARRGLLRRVNYEDHEKVTQALKEVGMLEQAEERMGALSGGQQQRVLIARALAGEPEVIFLDEPTVGVDREARENFYRLLRHLNEEHRLTIILITHDIESIAHEAMHIACIDCTLFYHESFDEYLKAEKVLHAGTPHVTPHHHV